MKTRTKHQTRAARIQVITPEDIGLRVSIQQYNPEIRKYREVPGSTVKLRTRAADVPHVVTRIQGAIAAAVGSHA